MTAVYRRRLTSTRASVATVGRRVFLALALALGLGGALGGCAGRPPPVAPWQREHLSRRAMRFDTDVLEARFRQHLFGSREGAEGGYGTAGGGCGCN